MVGFGAGAGLVVVVPCEVEPLELASWPMATVPNSSTAAGRMVHFENWKLISVFLLFLPSTEPWVPWSTQFCAKSCAASTGPKDSSSREEIVFPCLWDTQKMVHRKQI